MRINSVQEGDEGSYQCVVRNDGDSAQATGSLLLGGNSILYNYIGLIEISRPLKRQTQIVLGLLYKKLLSGIRITYWGNGQIITVLIQKNYMRQ